MNQIRMGPSSINRHAFKVLIMVGGLLALASPRGWAAAKSPTVLSFVESWDDKVACTGSNSQDDLDCEPYSLGKFTITAVITANEFGAAISPSQFNADTTFDLTLGEYSFSDTLGDAKYVAKGKTAKWLLTTEVCTANENNNGLPCPTKVYETITLSWTTKEVTLTITAETGTDANGNTFESAIDADFFDGDDSGKVTDTITFEMDLGNLSVSSSSLPVAGTVATKTVNDASGNQDTLSNVSISGTLSASELGH